jgi:hypothetical protein
MCATSSLDLVVVLLLVLFGSPRESIKHAEQQPMWLVNGNLSIYASLAQSHCTHAQIVKAVGW